MTAFKDTYFSPINNTFTRYSAILTLQLIGTLYAQFARISATDLAESGTKL